MSEQTQAKILEWIGTAAEKVGDFATQQIPPFVEEFLTWKFYEALVDVSIWSFVTLLWFVLGLVGVIWINRQGKLGSNDDRQCAFVVAIFISIFTFVFMAMALPTKEIKTCIQIKIAPKVYLVEYGANFIKK